MSNPALPPLGEPWPVTSLTDLARAAVALLDASRVWVFLRNAHGDLAPRIAVGAGADLAEAAGDATLSLDPRAAPPLVRQVAEQFAEQTPPRPLHYRDIAESPELLALVGADAAQIRSLAAVALVNEGETVGALVASGAAPGMFTSQARRRALHMLAGQAVAMIRLSFAAERYATRANELNALLGATEALTSALDSDAAFRNIIQSIQRVIAYDSALIYRFDERAKSLRLMTSLGVGSGALEGDAIPLDDPQSRAAWVARWKKPFIGPIGPEDRSGAHTDALRALRAGGAISLLCAPLISKGRLLGVASLARPQSFTQSEQNVMERLSPIAATALENIELYRAEHAARQQQEALFASASDGFALLDDKLRLLQVNEAFGRYVARAPAELQGQVCCGVFGAMTGPTITPAACLVCHGAGRCLLREASDTRAANPHLECVFPPAPEPPGSPHASSGPQVMARAIDFSVTPVPGRQGRPRLLLVGRDVSGPREVERLRAEHIHMVTHEIANPLQSILDYIDHFITVAGQQVSAEQLRFLQTAQATTLGMRALVDDFDLLSRRDANQWTINPQPTDLAAEAHSALVEALLAAQEKGVTLRERTFPQTPLALVDPTRARQVARNLIGNAIKFTPSGGETQVGVYGDAQWVTLRVEDTGPGVPDELKQKIWERNYRGPQPEGAPEIAGRGLGLAIVRIIVKKHGGEYDVQRAASGGAVFLVRFPRADLAPRR